MAFAQTLDIFMQAAWPYFFFISIVAWVFGLYTIVKYRKEIAAERKSLTSFRFLIPFFVAFILLPDLLPAMASGHETIINILSLAFLLLVLASFILGLFWLIHRYMKKTARPSRISALHRFLGAATVFFISLSLLSYISAFVNVQAVHEITDRLQSPIRSVEVDGNKIPLTSRLIADIRGMNTSSFRHHHSHPVGPAFTVVVLTEKGDVPLTLLRDVYQPHEYWVYTSLFKGTSSDGFGADIAFITTPAFDKPLAKKTQKP
jgi:hypothetical protein